MLESDELHKASVLVFANKQDVAGCMTATEISQQLSLQACITSSMRHLASITHAFQNLRKHQWQIQACCGLTGEGWVTIFASEFDPHLCFPGSTRGWSGLLVKLRGDPEDWRVYIRGVWRLGRTSIQIHSGILWCMWKQKILVLFHIFSYLSNCLEILTKSVPTHVTKNCSNVMLWDVDHDHCQINNQFNLWAPCAVAQQLNVV